MPWVTLYFLCSIFIQREFSEMNLLVKTFSSRSVYCNPISKNIGLKVFLFWLSRLWTWAVSTRMRVRSLVSLSGLRIWHCRELWRRSQVWVWSCVAMAVAQAGSYSSNWTPSLGVSICCSCGPKKQRKKKYIYIYTLAWRGVGMSIVFCFLATIGK